ncbi:glycosyltransferase family 4 protein [Paenibacillus glycanilyticus]|uniref:glycosyltransferase family 4 protein n=1 Tax=Paenibacillus glycanilyticus TaxID=126569 RepID=UPI00190FE73C|nr:glycosyltransferase family 4 protein [Paenibacillus glycanilyticus]
MKMKRICFVAQFPPPIHGLSKAVDTLYESKLKEQFDFEKVDISRNKRFVKSLLLLWKSKADLFYFTISQTKFGNIRDLIILKILSYKKKKCIIHLHGGYYRKLIENDISNFQSRLNYKAINNLDGVIVLSESLKTIFAGMIADEKIFVVPNCVDNQYLMSNDDFEAKVSAIEASQVFQVLYLSNFIKSKGYFEVLEMAKIESERVKFGESQKYHFNFAGKFFNDDERKSFFDYIDKNQLNNVVTYHGEVAGEKKKTLLKECHVFTLITRYPNEGQPISILEAMGNGMTVLTTDHAGIPDLVRDGVNGKVLNYSQQNNPMEMYKGLYCDKKIVLNNRKLILEKYKEEMYLESLRKLFAAQLETEGVNKSYVTSKKEKVKELGV